MAAWMLFCSRCSSMIAFSMPDRAMHLLLAETYQKAVMNLIDFL